MTVAPDVHLLELMRGYRQSHALYVAVRLGIADLLRDGPQSSAALAQLTASHAPSLTRLLRALASSGVFIETAPGVFGNSVSSEFLRQDHPNTRVPSVLFLGAPYTLESWSKLAESVRTGASAFEHAHGINKWRYNQVHPEDGAVFDAVMAGARPARISALVGGYDFSGSAIVVDVGGGQGHLLAALLAHNSELRGVLYDLPSALEQAPKLLAAAGVESRCSVVSGSFFDQVPEGDVHLLSDILHDWADEHCLAILKRCRAAMPSSGRLLILEYLLVPGATPPHIAWLDLQMLIEFGEGRQRSVEELSRLLDASGFQLERVVPTEDADIVVAVPR